MNADKYAETCMQAIGMQSPVIQRTIADVIRTAVAAERLRGIKTAEGKAIDLDGDADMASGAWCVKEALESQPWD